MRKSQWWKLEKQTERVTVHSTGKNILAEIVKIFFEDTHLLFLFYFNQVTGKILEEVYGLILVPSYNNVHIEPPGFFYEF